MTIFLQILFGLLGGFFGGLGMGGGTILIPLTTIFLGFDQQLSQGINLLTFLVMAVFSMWIHMRNGLIETKGIFWIILGGVVFAVGGSFLAMVLPSLILRKCFGVFLSILSVFEFLKAFPKQKKRIKNKISNKKAQDK